MFTVYIFSYVEICTLFSSYIDKGIYKVYQEIQDGSQGHIVKISSFVTRIAHAPFVKKKKAQLQSQS